MIRLEDVEKVYRTDRIETVALSSVNLEVAQGEFVSVMGPSGAGKSTLLNVIGLLDVPTKGRWRSTASRSTSYKDKRAGAPPQRADRLRLPDVPPDRGPHRPRQRRAPAALPDACRDRSAAGARSRRSTASGFARACTISPRSSPAASSSASRSRARSSASRASCSPTSPRGTSTARWATRSWRSCTASTRDEGRTIAMVTHDPRQAERRTAPSGCSTAGRSH